MLTPSKMTTPQKLFPSDHTVNCRREHILQEIEKEKITNQEEEVIEDFGEGYFAQYQRGRGMLCSVPER